MLLGFFIVKMVIVMSLFAQRGSQVYLSTSVDNLEREDSEVLENVPPNPLRGGSTIQNEDPDITREEGSERLGGLEISEVSEDVLLNQVEGRRNLQDKDPDITREENSESTDDLVREYFQSIRRTQRNIKSTEAASETDVSGHLESTEVVFESNVAVYEEDPEATYDVYVDEEKH